MPTLKLKPKRRIRGLGKSDPLHELATRAAALARSTAPSCPHALQVTTRVRPTGHVSVRIERLDADGAPLTLRQIELQT